MIVHVYTIVALKKTSTLAFPGAMNGVIAPIYTPVYNNNYGVTSVKAGYEYWTGNTSDLLHVWVQVDNSTRGCQQLCGVGDCLFLGGFPAPRLVVSTASIKALTVLRG